MLHSESLWPEGWTQMPGYHSVSATGAPPRDTKMCPRCGDAGKIDVMFGWREIDGIKRPQSYCRPCRSGRKKS